MATAATISTARAWWMAARPKTLSAAAVPVAVGAALAIDAGQFHLLGFLAALAGAFLIQIGTNLANDYFDHQKGADTADRLGPTRVVASGILAPHAVRNAMAAVFAAAFAVGLYLVWLGGWPILVVGLLSIVSGIAYTGGPYPLGYHGLGDLFVFVFFGVVAVCGTYWVQALSLDWGVVLASVPVGLLSVAILVVNNYRDIETDRRAGKRTLAVRLGRRATRLQYGACIVGAYVVPAVQAVVQEGPIGQPAWVLLPLLSAPLGVMCLRAMWRQTSGPELNDLLARTSKLLALFGLLYAVGLAL